MEDHNNLIETKTLVTVLRQDLSNFLAAYGKLESRVHILETQKAVDANRFITAEGPIVSSIHKRIDEQAEALDKLADAFKQEAVQRKWLGSFWTKLGAGIVGFAAIISSLLTLVQAFHR